MRQQEDPTVIIKTMDEIGPAVATKRNDRGSKSKDFYNWPEQPFEEMDSPLAAQQYIQQLIHKDPANVERILKLPEGQDLGAWKIEHLRMFCMQLNRLATKLQECCQPETCNQMTATEQWIFLCAAHKQPAECSAIDYTVHTLDGAANLLNSNKYFPSRVTIKESSVAKLASVCRRIYRIFSHAYYHHFQIFDEFERATHLCERFSSYVTMYDLMPRESLIVPIDGSKPDLEGEKVTIESQKMDTTMIESTATAAVDAPKSQSSEEPVETNQDSNKELADSTPAPPPSSPHSKGEIDATNNSKKSNACEPDVAATTFKATNVVTPKLASNVSKNTMVRGSTVAGSRISNSTDMSARKSTASDTKAIVTTTAATTTTTSTSAKTASSVAGSAP